MPGRECTSNTWAVGAEFLLSCRSDELADFQEESTLHRRLRGVQNRGHLGKFQHEQLFARTECRGGLVTWLLAALLAAVSMQAHAQPADLEYDLRVDIPVTAGALIVLVGLQLAKPLIAPTSPHWCDCNSDGSDALNGFDSAARNAFRWNDTSTANTLGNVVAYVLAPVGALGTVALAAHHDDALKNLPIDALIIAEAVVLAEALSETVKPLAGRERPFVHTLSEEDKALIANPRDSNYSFYSGHATWTFALATAAGTVATLRGYRFAPWVWVAGLTIATFVSYTRVAADRHYMTDVLTGAATGAAIGFAVPYFFHGPSESKGPKVSVSALQLGAHLTVSWRE